MNYCPGRFVIPGHGNDNDINYVTTNSSCAIPCLNPTYSSKEWSEFIKRSKVMSAIGFSCLSIALMNFAVRGDYKKDYQFLLVGIFSWFIVLSSTLMLPYSFEDVTCRDKAVRINANDGFNLCTLQSFIIAGGLAGMSFSWCSHSFNLFRKIVLRRRRNYLSLKYYFAALFVVVMLPMINLYVNRAYGFHGDITHCVFDDKNDGKIRLGAYFGFVFMTIGILFFMVTFMRIFGVLLESRRLRNRIHNDDEELRNSFDNQNMKIVSSLKFLIVYMFVVTVYFAVLWYFVLALMLERNSNNESFHEWLECIFGSSNSSSELSWRLRCGNHPARRFPPSRLYFSNIAVESLHSILLAITLLLLKPNQKRDKDFQYVMEYMSDWLQWHCGCASYTEMIEEEFEARILSEMRRRQNMNRVQIGLDHFNNLGHRQIELPHFTTDIRQPNNQNEHKGDNEKLENPEENMENNPQNDEGINENIKKYHASAGVRMREGYDNQSNLEPRRDQLEATNDSNAKCLESRSGMTTQSNRIWK